MEFLIVIGLFIVLFWWLSNRNDNDSGPPSHQNYKTPVQKKPSTTHRPKRTKRKSNISFKSIEGDLGSKPINEIDLEGLHDAFTGAKLNLSLGLFQCSSCKVFYHSESYDILKEVNHSKCVSCQSVAIQKTTPGKEPRTGKDHNPNSVTIETYKNFVGQVVTFEGYVHDVKESRRGNDFAVMFEPKSWTRGFKLIFFRAATWTKMKGSIKQLKGRTVQVRGLIIKHERFGYEIIASETDMILRVR